MRKLLAFALLLAAGALAWGYWHVTTHASIQVSIHDCALRTPTQSYGQPLTARVTLLDAAGRPLAAGTGSKPYGVIWIAHPQAGDCTRFGSQASTNSDGRSAWDQCFATTARWIPTWIGRVRFATVELPNCRIDKVPASVREYGDTWWLWWVPLPHIGGAPYTSYDVVLTVDSAHCLAASHP
ncbi:MAG: hypothetical protein HYX27_03870 [Acidobacteria bacterium]|nr:hypothetical protein [Acidobacteriota bacterium]